ncbi:dedicator of cytokinesis protein 1-like isoform X2 [Artemia franciscana]
MGTDWVKVPGNTVVVAIVNYQTDSPEKLSLRLGDVVKVVEEQPDWYFGCLVRNRAVRGIFPKTYVKVLKNEACKRDSGSSADLIIQEINDTLREWLIHWKNKFVQCSPKFFQVRKSMFDLLTFRSCLVLSNLASEDIKDIRLKVSDTIDHGNAILELDLVVRDNFGNPLDVQTASVIEVFRQHEKASQRIATKDRKLSPDLLNAPNALEKSNYTLFVAIRNFVCKVGEDAELIISVYDGLLLQPITESYYVTWDKKGLATDLEMLGNMKAFFTDFGSTDLRRERLLLVCNVVRLGGMEARENDNRKSYHISRKVSPESQMRRPFGVAMYDITQIMKGSKSWDEDKHCFIPFISCNEKESLDACLKRMLQMRDKDHKGQGLWCSFGLLQGNMNEISEEHPSQVIGNYLVARKIGFPETIVPGDIRNDLYINLVSADFSRGLGNERSIEVTIKVVDENGKILENVLHVGCEQEPKSLYKSVVYYHDDKPKWIEIVKVVMPTEEFYNSHLRFTFRHRASNENKDKQDKPFALSYARLIQKDGTTLKDGVHELMVYRVDVKNYKEGDVSYLSLPSKRCEATESVSKQISTLSYSPKDSFTVSSCLCSTKLTQNAELLGLLRWREPDTNIAQVLENFLSIDKNEVVRFLQDALDSLFGILMECSNLDSFDSLVFQCLIFLVSLVREPKYKQFMPILDLYIRENFSATLAYGKILRMMKVYSEKISEMECTACLDTMKSLPYLFKFVARSKTLYAALNDPSDDEDFEHLLEELFESFITLGMETEVHLLPSQCAMLRYLPEGLEDILDVVDTRKLSNLVVKFIEKIPSERFGTGKFDTLNRITEGSLFRLPSARSLLLPVILQNIQSYLQKGMDKQEPATCSKIMANIMDVLHRDDIGDSSGDAATIIRTMLPIVQKTLIWINLKEQRGLLVAILASIFRAMDGVQYYEYIASLVSASRDGLLDFIAQILCQFKDLVSLQVYPRDWSEMILLVNSYFLKAICLFSHTIRDHFANPFVEQVWNNFFQCGITFMTQESLQLESFSTNKRRKITSRYKDMRQTMAFEVRAMWFNLGVNKSHFIPSMVGPFLEMTLIPGIELRKKTIPIFFDMIQHEFYMTLESQRPDSGVSISVETFGAKKYFPMVENQMIQQLDTLIEGGRGDSHYKDLFFIILASLCEEHRSLKTCGVQFVQMATKLIERLLEYRTLITDEHRDNRMSCTVNILDFYREINKQEMYLRYLYKLYALHIECDNFGEAAYTLQLHAQLLDWSDDPVTDVLLGAKKGNWKTQREFKESLYLEMIELFDKGRMWEGALKFCKELIHEYEEEVFHYDKLSKLLRRMADFYDKIISTLRPEAEYFRVAFYGRGFSAFQQNKVYVYRGNEYEKIQDFVGRIQTQFPNAEPMQKLTPPSAEIKESPQQYLQINKVDPVMEEKERLSGKPIAEPILRYYRSNDVSKFTFSRPFHRGVKDKENEFATLWLERTVLATTYPLPGILRWFPVNQTEVFELSPLETAIETMEQANSHLKELIIANRTDPFLNYNPLSMKLQGMIDAAVNGGTAKYEQIFLTESHMKNHPEERPLISKLEQLLCAQTCLLEAGVEVHSMRVVDQMRSFHDHLESKFKELRRAREEKYGSMSLDCFTEKQLGVLIRLGARTTNHDVTSECRTSSSSGHSMETSSVLTVSSGKSQISMSSLSLTSTPKLEKASRQSSTASLLSMLSTPNFGTKRRDKDKKKKERKESVLATAEKKKMRDSLRRLSMGSSSNPLSFLTPSSSFSSNLSISTLTEASLSENDTSQSLTVTPGTPPIELSQELTCTRPLRPESIRERRNSGIRRLSNASQTSSSVTTPIQQRSMESLNSYEDQPPPLPAKTSSSVSMDFEKIIERSSTPIASLKSRVLPAVPQDELDNTMVEVDPDTPPTPPPKKPPLRINMKAQI